MKEPWLTVIMPTFNGERYIRQSLGSVLEQEDQTIEVIVIDDGSEDRTLDIINELISKTETEIRLLKKNHNGNWIQSTNEAMKIAQGEYLCWLHQDDFWTSERLQVIHEAIQTNQSPDWIVHPVKYFDQNNRCVGRWDLPSSWSKSHTREYFQESLIIQNCLSVPGVTFKRKLFNECGPMNVDLWYVGDWEYWIRFSCCSLPIIIPKALAGFRIHPESQTVRRSDEFASLQDQYNWILSHQGNQIDQETQRLAKLSAEINLLLLNSNFIKAAMKILKLLIFSSPRVSQRFLDETRLFNRILPRVKLSLRNRFARLE